MANKKQKNILTLKQKVEIVNTYNKEKLSFRDLAKIFNIGKTQAAGIIKNKDELMLKWNSNTNVNQKRSFLKTEGLNVDKLCYEWFIKARNKNMPLSGTLVRSKAKEIAGTLGYQTFTASSGWLEKFQIRHNISFKSISGESTSVRPDVTSFVQKVPSLIEGYQPKDIYNADETGLFFRALPDKTLALKCENCVGGKLSKERVTILHCVNMAGEKEKLLVIGKAAKPRAFKNVDVNLLPVTWKSNKNAWMTRDIMREWLLHFDRSMTLQKRKILLFLDNAGSHPRDVKLKSIKIVFLPPNTTCVCQPLVQGIIKCFKTSFRNTILKHSLSKMNTGSSAVSKTIDLLDAVYFINDAWMKVSSLTIQNCFRKSRISFEGNENDDDIFDAEGELPLSSLADIFKTMKEIGFDAAIPIDFLNIDENLVVEDDDVVISILTPSVEIIEESDEDSDGSGDSAVIKTYQEALKTTHDLKLFAKRNGDTEALQLTTNLQLYLENMLTRNRVKQGTILNHIIT